MSVLLEFSMFPTDRGESVSGYVARLVEIVHASGLPYKLGAMGTTLEGQAPEVFEVVQKCLADLQRDTRRVTAFIKLDWRAGRTAGLTGKVASVTKRISHPVET
ncbi:MAG: hypothetical protein AMJ81_02650 [Phycisphaerae bacterium SM23_33]|jgi:uncharacterized protein (TIGR00106 family)|nr:MAG: hypothetical protein AMJ81_02650 [Phycisphaerae bacterium SM23_33]